MFVSRIASSILLVTVLGLFLMPTSLVEAKDTPPPPIVVTEEFISDSDVIRPLSDFYGPSGERVVVTNRYYPWYNDVVRTDGWTDATFRQPGISTIICKSKVENDQGQISAWAQASTGWGATSCGPTPIAEIEDAVKPAIYTSRTQGFWDWLNGSDAFGESVQSHNES